MACGEFHPGLCAHTDAAIYDNALLLGKSLEACLESDWLHSFIEAKDLQARDPERPQNPPFAAAAAAAAAAAVAAWG
jgi:hypothetical protein